MKKIKRLPILGSEAFIKTITGKYLSKDDPNKNISDYLTQKQLLPIRNVDFIIKTVAKHYQIEVGNIKTVNHRRHGNQPRTITIYLSILLSNQNLWEITKEFSNISRYGISQTYRRMKNRLIKDKSLTNEIETIKNKIIEVK